MGESFFITTTVTDWVDVFSRPLYKHIILDSLHYCQQQKGLVIYAWVLMTNHLHLIAGVKGDYSISDIMRDFKRYTSLQIIRVLQNNVQESRRNWMLNRFEHAALHDRKVKKYKFWQEGNDIQQLVSEDYLQQKLHYIHQNPVKAEFVNVAENYRYSSAIDYSGGKGILEIERL